MRPSCIHRNYSILVELRLVHRGHHTAQRGLPGKGWAQGHHILGGELLARQRTRHAGEGQVLGSLLDHVSAGAFYEHDLLVGDGFSVFVNE